MRAVTYPVSDLDVFVGPNGVGRTNLYRALELLRSAAANTLARDLMHDGGLQSALWVGDRRRTEPARIRLGARFGDPCRATSPLYRYEVEIGFPPAEASASHVRRHTRTNTF